MDKKSDLIKVSFRTTYYFLIFSSCLSFFVSCFIKNREKKYILWLESTITGIASCIYYFYNKYKLINWEDIDRLRYIDWSITTPLMLISLILLLSMYSGIKINPVIVLVIVLLDWIMLLFGYLGEKNILSKIKANICGFIPFIIIFIILYMIFIKNNNILINNILFTTYLILWSMYGILYMFDKSVMNTYFNILDCVAKVFVSIFITLRFICCENLTFSFSIL